MNTEGRQVIGACALMTCILRLVPALLVDKIQFRPKLEKFLKLIPYTAIVALVFPGVLFVDTVYSEIVVVGGIIAILLAW